MDEDGEPEFESMPTYEASSETRWVRSGVVMLVVAGGLFLWTATSTGRVYTSAVLAEWFGGLGGWSLMRGYSAGWVAAVPPLACAALIFIHANERWALGDMDVVLVLGAFGASLVAVAGYQIIFE